MIRGTTPTFEFTLPMLTDEIAAGYITFAQDGSVVIDKDLADCTCAGSTVTLHLTQEETLKLSQNTRTELQMRVRTTGGEALATRVYIVPTERILKDGGDLMLRIDVAFKQTRQTLELDMAAGDQTLELTFDNFQRVDGAADYYDGAYDVTPLITAQRLPTRSKTMRDDVRIEMIPTREIPNAAGGVTFIVGG